MLRKCNGAPVCGKYLFLSYSHVAFIIFLSYYGAGELLDQISIVKSSSLSEGVSRCICSPFLSCSHIILTDVIKHRQSKPGSKCLR